VYMPPWITGSASSVLSAPAASITASTASRIDLVIVLIGKAPPASRLRSVFHNRSTAVSWFGHVFQIHPIPDPLDAFQVPRRGGRRFNLPPQISDLVIYDP